VSPLKPVLSRSVRETPLKRLMNAGGKKVALRRFGARRRKIEDGIETTEFPRHSRAGDFRVKALNLDGKILRQRHAHRRLQGEVECPGARDRLSGRRNQCWQAKQDGPKEKRHAR
jgi:hypothetical protein